MSERRSKKIRCIVMWTRRAECMSQCVAECCSALQRVSVHVAVCCRVLQSVAVRCSVLWAWSFPKQICDLEKSEYLKDCTKHAMC